MATTNDSGSGIPVENNRETPVASNGPTGLASSRRLTRGIARGHYENFVVASILLPRGLRQPFYDIYAFCRTADDFADESPSAEVATRRLRRLRRDLAATYAGSPPPGIFPALGETIGRFGLPESPFLKLLDAFEQDQRVTRYATREALVEYAEGSAVPVGELVLRLAGAHRADTIGPSADICIGLQFANFWQDVARDHAIGRIYMPSATMARFGVDESMFRRATAPEPLRRAIASECLATRVLLERGLVLAERVPRWLAADVRLFAHGGLAILDEIRRAGHDILRRRPVVSRRRQAVMLLKAWLGWL